MNIINHQSLIATKTSRVVFAANGDGIMEFGLRRAQGPDAGLYGARAAMIGGCVGTSNVLAGKLFDVPVMGTHAYGKDRTYRTCFTKEELKGFACEAQILEDRWTISFRIGIDILERIYGPLHLQAGSTFTCNFYKISEAKEIEHYASYSPIKTTIPSFHLPEFFAMAEIVKRQGQN